jgi:hypothetical protein
MTDHEITRATAEEVMGWEYNPLTVTAYNGEKSTQDSWKTEWGLRRVHEWWPLSNENHTGELLDRMQSCGWAYDIGTYRHGRRMTDVRFILGETERGVGEASVDGVDGEARRRAICEAALAAVRGGGGREE